MSSILFWTSVWTNTKLSKAYFKSGSGVGLAVLVLVYKSTASVRDSNNILSAPAPSPSAPNINDKIGGIAALGSGGDGGIGITCNGGNPPNILLILDINALILLIVVTLLICDGDTTVHPFMLIRLSIIILVSALIVSPVTTSPVIGSPVREVPTIVAPSFCIVSIILVASSNFIFLLANILLSIIPKHVAIFNIKIYATYAWKCFSSKYVLILVVSGFAIALSWIILYIGRAGVKGTERNNIFISSNTFSALFFIVLSWDVLKKPHNLNNSNALVL